jgi:hypothetical protein
MKTFFLALIGAIAIAGGAAARMQEPPKAHEHGEQTMPAAPTQQAAMMQHMMQMKASMEAKDKHFDDLVAQLNAARGNDRVDHLVAVVNALVAERKVMHEHMNGMMKTMHENAR